MSARQYPTNGTHTDQNKRRIQEHAANTAFVERARALLADVDVMNADDLARARDLLRCEGIPQWTLFALKDAPPVTEVGIEWAERRLAELRASGDVS